MVRDDDAPTVDALIDELAALPDGSGLGDVGPILRRMPAALVGADAMARAEARSRVHAHVVARMHVPAATTLVAAAFAVGDEATAERKSRGQGRAVAFNDPEPWSDDVDGAALLDAMANQFARYVILPKGAAHAAALWVLHTYASEAADTSPRLVITSPQMRCGKSTLLDVLAALVRHKMLAANISPAAFYRVIAMHSPTMLVDEADTILPGNDELRGVMNAGHTRGRSVVKTVGDDHEPCEFDVFGPLALAGIGAVPPTIADRAIELRMIRKLRGEKVERLKRRQLEAVALPLRRQAMRWAADHLANLRAAEPALPGALNDRQCDGWEPLFAIADAAGDKWPVLAREAALTLAGAAESDHGDRGTMLLSDLRDIFGAADKLASGVVVAMLVAMEDRPWPEWNHGKPLTAPGLARVLKPYDVKPKQIRFGGENQRGYDRAQLSPLWDRYLAPVVPKKAEPRKAAVSPVSRDSGVQTATALQPVREKDFFNNLPATTKNDVAGKKTQNPLREKDHSGVAGKNPESRESRGHTPEKAPLDHVDAEDA